MSRLPAATRIEELDWVPRLRTAALRRLGLQTLGDLLKHFPRRYENRVKFDRFPDEASETPVCLFGIVRKTVYRRFGPRRIFEARIEDESAGVLGSPLICRWFNMPWVQKMVAGDQQIVVFGKPRVRNKQVVMEHPEFEIIEEDAERSIHFDRITPVYPAGDGVTPRALRVLVHRALEETDPATVPLLWPGNAVSERVWREVHFPESFEELENARQQLVREEFFGIQLVVCARHAAMRNAGGSPKPESGTWWRKVEESLPFEMTASQRKVMAEISADQASPHRMNRLLQGDVGSGKTLVALHAMLQAAEAGWQAALMAPTQILAEQHYLNFRRMLDPLGIPVVLRTAARKESSGGTPAATPGTQDGAHASRRIPPLVIGTHALLFEKAGLERPGLIVIDEQHKFGVLQRSRLIAQGDAPDVLVMTATPIPRTITQTLYGDLDVSIIREKPAGRGRVITAVREPSKLPEIIKFLRDKISEGRQAYIVYPLVEESEKLDVKAARAEFEKWTDLLAPAKVGLVHGRLDPGEKELVMRQFRDGTISALVATTVIEVGVDVPNACIMLVEEAGRFGLSQLHQLRGRIGRGAEKSYCILLQEDPGELAKAKLSVLERTSDGFEIAEADLNLRGPGDILGTAQAGLPPLRLGNLLRDGELMSEARKVARALLESDPDLSLPGHGHFREFVESAGARLAVSES
ncbi:MAG: ATP-dependent DNA helicase RecG [Verrucomicrobia bacterium]|nr:ATP-dependent DNA helicase RecG [Verrucomicrobiota bacterium]